MDKLTKIVFLLMALGCVLIFLLYFLFQKFEIGTAEKTDIVLNPNQKILAQIDNINISFQDVQYKINIEKVYGNVEVDAPLAFIMLVNDTFEELIAQKYGILPTNAEVISFINHYDSTTIAPEILKKIKSIFGADTASFYRLFITPKIINQKLRNYYWYTPEFHIKSILNAEDLFKALSNGKPLPKEKFSFTTDTLKQDFSKIYNQKQSYNCTNPESQIRLSLNSIKPGQVTSVIEIENAFILLKLIKKNNTNLIFEKYTIKKVDFNTWFIDEAKNLSLIIIENNLRTIISQKYSQLWWTQIIQKKSYEKTF